MAHMDIHYGFSVNGVAALHTQILEKSELQALLSMLYPGKVQQQDQRHHLPPLADGLQPGPYRSLSTEMIGPGWKQGRRPSWRSCRLRSRTTKRRCEQLLAIKQENKRDLCRLPVGHGRGGGGPKLRVRHPDQTPARV